MKGKKIIADRNELKYSIRAKMYVNMPYRQRCKIIQNILDHFNITRKTWYIWLNIKIGDSQELPLATIMYIAKQIGCDWVDLLNPAWQEELASTG